MLYQMGSMERADILPAKECAGSPSPRASCLHLHYFRILFLLYPALLILGGIYSTPFPNYGKVARLGWCGNVGRTIDRL